MIGSLETSISNAIMLVMILVIAALGLRSALLVGLSIPTSFLVGFLIVDMMGMTLNMMIMFGFILSVGILVDGAIVVVEYADRKMAEGVGRREAYAMASSRMFWPILSSTATTLAAFGPMLLAGCQRQIHVLFADNGDYPAQCVIGYCDVVPAGYWRSVRQVRTRRR